MLVFIVYTLIINSLPRIKKLQNSKAFLMMVQKKIKHLLKT